MKAYIDINKDRNKFVSFVVSEQDYHEGGPHAHSFRFVGDSLKEAELSAEAWAERNGYTIATVDEVAG